MRQILCELAARIAAVEAVRYETEAPIYRDKVERALAEIYNAIDELARRVGAL